MSDLSDWDSESEHDIQETNEAAFGQPDTESSDPDTHTEAGYQYGRREIRGKQYQQWMDGNAEAPCPVKPAILTLDDELMELDVKTTLMMKLPAPFSDEALRALGLGPGPGPNGEFAEVRIKEILSVSESNPMAAKNRWVAFIGKGFIVMPEIFRLGAGCYSSEVFHAIYTHYYPIESLTHCFVSSVVNFNTKKLIKRLYTAKGYEIPPDGRFGGYGGEAQLARDPSHREAIKERLWEVGTAEHTAILGTRIGGVVATLVLGAFPPGTKRVSQIQTSYKWNASCLYSLEMRFDISNVN